VGSNAVLRNVWPPFSALKMEAVSSFESFVSLKTGDIVIFVRTSNIM
jgi:hypothetical protein